MNTFEEILDIKTRDFFNVSGNWLHNLYDPLLENLVIPEYIVYIRLVDDFLHHGDKYKHKEMAGICSRNLIRKDCDIELNKKLFDCRFEFFLDVFLHEFFHIWCHSNGYNGHDGDDDFEKTLEIFGVTSNKNEKDRKINWESAVLESLKNYIIETYTDGVKRGKLNQDEWFTI